MSIIRDSPPASTCKFPFLFSLILESLVVGWLFSPNGNLFPPPALYNGRREDVPWARGQTSRSLRVDRSPGGPPALVITDAGHLLSLPRLTQNLPFPSPLYLPLFFSYLSKVQSFLRCLVLTEESPFHRGSFNVCSRLRIFPPSFLPTLNFLF